MSTDASTGAKKADRRGRLKILAIPRVVPEPERAALCRILHSSAATSAEMAREISLSPLPACISRPLVFAPSFQFRATLHLLSVRLLLFSELSQDCGSTVQPLPFTFFLGIDK